VFDTYSVVQGIEPVHAGRYVRSRMPPRPEQLIQSIIDLQDKIQREGTINAKEFLTPQRQLEKRALLQILPGETIPRVRPLELVQRGQGSEP